MCIQLLRNAMSVCPFHSNARKRFAFCTVCTWSRCRLVDLVMKRNHNRWTQTDDMVESCSILWLNSAVQGRYCDKNNKCPLHCVLCRQPMSNFQLHFVWEFFCLPSFHLQVWLCRSCFKFNHTAILRVSTSTPWRRKCFGTRVNQVCRHSIICCRCQCAWNSDSAGVGYRVHPPHSWLGEAPLTFCGAKHHWSFRKLHYKVSRCFMQRNLVRSGTGIQFLKQVGSRFAPLVIQYMPVHLADPFLQSSLFSLGTGILSLK